MSTPAWHTLSKETTLNTLHTSFEGLTESEATQRAALYGPNRVVIPSKDSPWRLFLRQFHSPLIYVLLVAGIGTCLIGKWTDSIVIFSVILLNTLIGFIQDYKSGQAIKALLQFVPETTRVIRSGTTLSLSAHELVPGDIVLLEAGDKVPADLRLLQLKNLKCDESSLTGESLPVSKHIEPLAENTHLAERSCMAYSGTFVTTGTAQGVVVAIGLHTEFGKISSLLKGIQEFKTPLIETLNKVAKTISVAIALLALITCLIAYLRGYGLVDAFIASIALAVAAIPEGLPATITITAAIGVQTMARKKAIIRNLPTVETLGSTTVICTDKTGTLTENQMTVRRIFTPLHHYHVEGQGYVPEGQITSAKGLAAKEELVALEELLIGSVLCNDASMTKLHQRWIFCGDPTELALIVAARKHKIHEETLRQEYPRIDVIPFESEKRIMATLHKHKQDNILFIKGSPETIFAKCKAGSFDESAVHTMAKQGMRVLAVAKKHLSSSGIQEEHLTEGFTFLGLLGMIDPPRQGVTEAIASCQSAGITIKMITGDHPLTAGLIASELGLCTNEKVITGDALDHLSDEQFDRVIADYHVFARALPSHKLRIVSALQKHGEIVAMTGDGVNDAPALKQAHIGIAMGISGTSVAKEVADMVLADDNFISIKLAVEEGRRIFDNLVKSLAFVLPTNLTQALMILIAIFFFPITHGKLLLPVMPIQILWINLVVAVSLALPLAFEAIEPDVMQLPPRKQNAPLLNRFIFMRMLLITSLMVAGTIALFFHEYPGGIKKAQTMAVTALMFFQMIYLIHCRSLRYSIFKIGITSNPYLWLGITVALLSQLGFVYLPWMNELMGSEPLPFGSWLICLALSLIISPAIAIEKRLARKSIL